MIAFQAMVQYPLQQSKPTKLRNRLRNIVPQIEALQKVGGTAGMSVGVMSYGEVVLDHKIGFADVERQLMADNSTRYPLASLTKAFVAVTIAQLVDEGILQWDAPLVTYIPELAFESDPSLASHLALIDLLSHQTGLAQLDSFWVGANGQVIISKNFTIALCNRLPSVFPIRSQYLYNNWMYALAGEVIERVTTLSWGKVLETRVLEKLGLSQTSVIGSDSLLKSTALPYMILDDKTPARTGHLDLLDGSFMSSTGGVRSTLHDMLTWGNSLISVFWEEEPPIEGLETILSGHSLMNKSISSDELYTLGFAKAITPTQFGKLGLNPTLVDHMPIIGKHSNPTLVFYHPGIGTGYSHCFMLVPEHQAIIVVLTNSISHGDIADWVAQTVLQAVLDMKSPLDLTPHAELAANRWRKKYGLMAKTLKHERIPQTTKPPHQDLLGTFRHETGAMYIDVFEEDDKLKFNLNGRFDQEHALSHYHNDTFIFLPSAEERIRRGLYHYDTKAWLLHFQRDSRGKVSHIIWNLDSQSPTGEKFIRPKSKWSGMRQILWTILVDYIDPFITMLAEVDL